MENKFVEKAVYDYSKSLLRVAFAYVKNTSDAEDIVQDVFLSLIKTEKIFESPEHLKAWLLRTAINKCKNHVKSHWFSRRKELSDSLSYLPPEDLGLIEAVMMLDKRYRIPIHLFYYEGYSIKEISEILNKKPGTVGSYLDRGRKQLREMLGGEFNEE